MHEGFTHEDDIVARNSAVATKREDIAKRISKFFSIILKPKIESEIEEEEIYPI
jgi:hypothetical protein